MGPKTYQQLAKEYDIEARVEYLVGFFNMWRRDAGYPDGSIDVSVDVVTEVVLNYYTDIDRYKKFHGVDLANTVKVAAFTISWWIRLRPIHILAFDDANKANLLYANEKYCLTILLSFLYDRSVLTDEGDPDALKELLFKYTYHWRHRFVDPQTVEVAIESLLTQAPYPRTQHPPLSLE